MGAPPGSRGDYSRLAYCEVLADEKGPTCAAFLLRAAGWFAGHGITVRQVMSGNAMNYVTSTDFANALTSTGSQHITIRPHCPWQNGKVCERFNRTLAIEWAYRQPLHQQRHPHRRPRPLASQVAMTPSGPSPLSGQ